MTPGPQHHLKLVVFAATLLTACASLSPASTPAPTEHDAPQGTSWSGRWISPSAYAHYIEARIHHERGRLDAAIANMELAIVFDDASPYLNAYFAELLSVSGEFERARAVLSRAFALEPDHAYAYNVSAQLAARDGDLKRADLMATRAIELDPEQQGSWQTLINLKLKQGRHVEVTDLLNRHLARWPDDPWARLLGGKLAQEAGDFAAAIEHFEALNEVRPRLLTGFIYLGAVYQRAGQIEDAYETFVACTESHNLEPGCWLRRISTKLRLVEEGDDTQAALEHDVKLMAETLMLDEEIAQSVAEKLLSANHFEPLKLFVTHGASTHPGLRGLHYYLGVLHLRRYERQQAIAAFEKVPQQSDTFLESRAKMAIALSELDKHDLALDSLEAALETQPEVAEIWALKAALLERARRHRDALKVLKQASDRFPDRPEFLYRFANVARLLKQNREAQLALERKLTLTPDDIETLNLLGRILAEQGTELKRAETLLLHAVSRSRVPNGLLSDTLGLVYVKMGRLPEAISQLETAVKLLPGKRDVLERLGDAYVANNQPESASSIYQRALKSSRDKADLKRLRRKLRNLNASHDHE